MSADDSVVVPAENKVEEHAVTPAVPQPTDDCVVKEGEKLPDHCVKKEEVKTDSTVKHEGDEGTLAQAVVNEEETVPAKADEVVPQPAEAEHSEVKDAEVPVVPELVDHQEVKQDAAVPADGHAAEVKDEGAAPVVPAPEEAVHEDSQVPQCGGGDKAVEQQPAVEEHLAMDDASGVKETSTMTDDEINQSQKDLEEESVLKDAETPMVPEPVLPVCKEPGEENCTPAGEVVPESAPKVPVEEVPVEKHDGELAQAATVEQPKDAVEGHADVVVPDEAPVEEKAPVKEEVEDAVPEAVPAAPAEAVEAQPAAPADAAKPAEETKPAEEQAAKPGEFHDRLKKFSVQFPEKWELRKGMAGMDVVGISPLEGPEDRFRENVNIASQVTDQPIDMKMFFDEGQKALSEQLPGFKLIGSGDLTVSGLPVKWIEFNQASGNVEATVKQFYIIADSGKRAFIITGAAPPDKFDNFRGVMDKIVQSFKFDNQ